MSAKGFRGCVFLALAVTAMPAGSAGVPGISGISAGISGALGRPRLSVLPSVAARSDTLAIEVEGAPAGSILRFDLLRDCSGDQHPDTEGSGDCHSPLFSWRSDPTTAPTTVHQTIRLAEHADWPAGVFLWLRATAIVPGGGEVSSLDRQLVLKSGDCGGWLSLTQRWFKSGCVPNLVAALFGHWGAAPGGAGRAGKIFLVAKGKRGAAISGTAGATGAAWLSGETLVVTLASSGVPSGNGQLPLHPERSGPGLYRIRRDGTEKVRLWSADPGIPVAPFAKTADRIYFFLDPPKEQPALPSRLLLWTPQGLAKNVEIGIRVERVLGSDEDRSTLLVLAREKDGPRLFEIDTRDGSVTDEGFHPGVYLAALRSPSGSVAVVEHLGLDDRSAWTLRLVDADGQNPEVLQARSDRPPNPVWRPDGAEIAYLGKAE